MSPLTSIASVPHASGARRTYGAGPEAVRPGSSPAADAASMPLATEAEERAVSIRLMEESAEDWQEEIEYLYPRRTS
ncbi:MAG: hypothetical protein HEQ38_20290 [Gemmatimonas sp.]|uniref:hypothetical protein n=1 Tax=Gemmatimonas sp. TaxID=1962908 RepID=UPI0031CA98E7|nr:hypothetical protein [Gemmatimonas sp.]